MGVQKKKNKKTKRKNKQKARSNALRSARRSERVDFFLLEADYYKSQGKPEKAISLLKKALKADPINDGILVELVHLGYDTKDQEIQLEALTRLHRIDQLEDGYLPVFIDLLLNKNRYQLAMEMCERLKERIAVGFSKSKQKKLKRFAEDNWLYCQVQLMRKPTITPPPPSKSSSSKKISPKSSKTAPVLKSFQFTDQKRPSTREAVSTPFRIDVDTVSFEEALTGRPTASFAQYEVAMEAHRIRISDSFENLICLSGLTEIRSLWYQEETARKVMKTFRGRALLSDEVGLGKTIEAGMILKEYVQRGMVKNALILTPTPLVSQWKEELFTKLHLDFPSTDDPAFRTHKSDLWNQPFVLASINQAKSKRHFKTVTDREYDMVIVDEAHHLKNRNTLNWKLVNALKKRFLLLLTATPVENNLMELYNLVTLLKPGQLKTATEFRRRFMTKGDPTSPQNRVRLKELLGQVMIRNTRALAKINIPPRFAETIRIDPTASEKEMYERITELVHDINQFDGTGNKLLLKHLLAEAGSSPRAVETTLTRMLGKKALLLRHEEQIRAIRNLSRSMADTSKNKVLAKLIRATPGKKIIFIKYLGTLDQITDFLDWEKIPHAVFHGRMDNSAKDEQIRQFRDEKDILVTTEIGGEGRNLQFCHQMINYDLPWNPMKIEQRIGRIHRIGQESEVRIFNMCATGSLEDYILEILDRKINMFEMVIGEIDMVLGRIRGEKDFADQVYDIWKDAASSNERKKGFTRLATQLKRSKTQYQSTKTLDEKLFGENYEL